VNNLDKIAEDFKFLPNTIKLNFIERLIKDVTSEKMLTAFLVEDVKKLSQSGFIDGELEQLILKRSRKMIDIQIKLLFEGHFIDDETSTLRQQHDF